MERLKTKAELLAMLPVMEPAVPPLPIESVPADTVVRPVNVLLPVSVSVPGPLKTKAPLPERSPPTLARSLVPRSGTTNDELPVVVKVWSV